MRRGLSPPESMFLTLAVMVFAWLFIMFLPSEPSVLKNAEKNGAWFKVDENTYVSLVESAKYKYVPGNESIVDYIVVIVSKDKVVCKLTLVSNVENKTVTIETDKSYLNTYFGYKEVRIKGVVTKILVGNTTLTRVDKPPKIG